MKREDIEKAAKVWAKDEITKSRIERGKRHLRPEPTGASTACGMMQRCTQPFRAFVILHDTENDFMMLTQHSITCDSDYNVIYQENDNMIAWAYIEDLIPNTEE